MANLFDDLMNNNNSEKDDEINRKRKQTLENNTPSADEMKASKERRKKRRENAEKVTQEPKEPQEKPQPKEEDTADILGDLGIPNISGNSNNKKAKSQDYDDDDEEDTGKKSKKGKKDNKFMQILMGVGVGAIVMNLMGKGNKGGQGQSEGGGGGETKRGFTERIAMIIIATMALFATLSFATFMITTLVNRPSNRGVDGVLEIAANIHKGGTVEGMNNPNKKVWTIEDRKPFPYRKDGTYLLVRNETGGEDTYHQEELRTFGYDPSEIAERGHVWVKYLIDNDTKDILQVSLDGVVDEFDPYTDDNIVRNSEGKIIDIKKETWNKDNSWDRELTQSEFESMTKEDQELYMLARAEERLDMNASIEADKPMNKAKEKVKEVTQQVSDVIKDKTGITIVKETEEDEEVYTRRDFKINLRDENGNIREDRKLRENTNVREMQDNGIQSPIKKQPTSKPIEQSTEKIVEGKEEKPKKEKKSKEKSKEKSTKDSTDRQSSQNKGVLGGIRSKMAELSETLKQKANE